MPCLAIGRACAMPPRYPCDEGGDKSCDMPLYARPAPHSRDGRPPTMLTTHPFDDDKLREECGVFGIYGADTAAARRRARPARAPASRPGSGGHHQLGRPPVPHPPRDGPCRRQFRSRRGDPRLPGEVAIGHVRYATTGDTALRNVQPLYRRARVGRLRGRAQRQHLQRDEAAARARPARLDLPVDQRHRGDHPPRRDLHLPHAARSLHRRAQAGRGRLFSSSA